MKRLGLWLAGIALVVSTVPAISWIPAGSNKLKYTASNEDPSGNDLALIRFNQYIDELYNSADLQSSGLDHDVYHKALIGYYNLKNQGRLSSDKNILTIVDFNKSSRDKRLWIIDISAKKLLFNTLVAHGQGSGDDVATLFSNTENSHKSSIGFYVTNETYIGQHGLSLKIDGMDKGFNSNARDRAVVIHGADYVSQSFIDKHGRLGRSYGCPALPAELNATIINQIKDKTCLFINGNAGSYSSDYLNEENVVKNFAETDTVIAASGSSSSLIAQ